MNVYVRNIVFDCSDARALGDFYAELLGWRVVREDWVVVAKDEESLPRLAFEEVEGYRPPLWPDPERAYPQQMHLCLGVDDSTAAQERALRLGATPLPAMGGSCPVFADPDGHPFCLCAQNE
ncbi:VOC family protein [Streptomyces sp. B6B3]|uniref:VOC family protein n=1 Tax=Streptomyces sp. B6B3 TaxID=3153570 RepID=UPI00325F4C6D